MRTSQAPNIICAATFYSPFTFDYFRGSHYLLSKKRATSKNIDVLVQGQDTDFRLEHNECIDMNHTFFIRNIQILLAIDQDRMRLNHLCKMEYARSSCSEIFVHSVHSTLLNTMFFIDSKYDQLRQNVCFPSTTLINESELDSFFICRR